MSEVKTSGLTAGTPPYVATSLLPLSVDTGGGTFASRKANISDLFAVSGLQNTTYAMSVSATLSVNENGLLVSNSVDNHATMALRATGAVAHTTFEQAAFGGANQTNYARANGTPGAPTAPISGQSAWYGNSFGFDGTNYVAGVTFNTFFAENWDGTHHAAAYTISTIDLLSETKHIRWQITGNGDTQILNGALLQTHALSAPTTGATVAMGQWERSRSLNPAGALANLTLLLPASPHDGQMASYGCTQAVTNFAVQDSAGVAANVVGDFTTLTAGQGQQFTFNSGDGKWYVG